MVNNHKDANCISSGRLRDIIETQTCVATLGLDLDAVLEMVAERSRLLTNSVACSVELANDSSMVFRSVSPSISKSLFLRLTSGYGCHSGSYTAAGEARNIEDSDNSLDTDLLLLRQHGLLVVPLNHLDQQVGVLTLMSANPSGFTRADRDILEMISPLCSASLYNAVRYSTSSLFKQATTDFLTDLPNRGLFLDRLRSAHMIANREDRRMGVLMLDMDDLKSINDRFGHRAGDAAILEMGQRIKAEVRDADTVARFGGDEFAVVLYDIEDQKAAESVIDRINRRYNEPFVVEGNIMPLKASIGMALYPEDSREWETLMAVADRRMYEHKRAKLRLTSPLASGPCADGQYFPGQRPASAMPAPARDRI